MNIYKIKKISDILSYIILAVGLGITIKVMYDRFTLPANVCPINNNTPMIYIGLSLLAASLVLSTVVDQIYKKKTKNTESNKDE